MILVFGFKNRICQDVIEAIRAENNPAIELRYIGSGLRIFRDFASELATNKYDVIVGIGATSRGIHVRSEVTCFNIFRRKMISDGPASYALPRAYLGPTINDGNSIGHSFCNAIAYTVMDVTHPKSFTYLHVPKKADPNKLAETISAYASSGMSS